MSNLIRIFVIISLCSLVFLPEIKSQSSSELVQSGLSSYQDGDYETALNSFNSVLQTSGSDVDSDLPLTGESQEVDDSESKIELTGESQMEYTGESKETYTGESQIKTADVSNIQEYSDPLNYVGGDPANIYLYRGQTYLKLGNTQAALSDFDRAISLDPSFADAYFRRAIVNYQVDADKACPDLQTAINEGHQSAKELYNLICK